MRHIQDLKKTPQFWIYAEIDAESELMQALAEVDEDERPDDGAVEIASEDEYIEWGGPPIRVGGDSEVTWVNYKLNWL